MIRVPGQNGRRAVDLFEQKHAHQLVWQRHRAESDEAVGTLAEAFIESIGTADRESQR